MGYHTIKINSEKIYFGELMESFLESSWYSPYLEIEKVILGRKSLSERNKGVTKTQKCQEDTEVTKGQ